MVIFFMSVYAFIVYPVIYVKCIRNSSLEEVDEVKSHVQLAEW